MTLLEQINLDLKTAIKEGNTPTKNILRVVIGEINRQDKNISDDKIIGIIKKMRKNAVDLYNVEEAVILDKYLPEELTENDIKGIITEIIDDNNLSSMKDIGLIMKELNVHPQSKQIDKKTASRIIKELFI